MNILDKIVIQKKKEIELAQGLKSISELEKSIYFDRIPLSFNDFIRNPERTGIIAEFKRQSPSKGLINGHSTLKEVTTGYVEAGASALSVLSDTSFFGGSQADVMEARSYHEIPILRKDFILSAYQIFEAKAWGADVILLIAAILSPQEIKALAKQAKLLGMSVLLEVHDQAELQRNLDVQVDAIGVNNRNLGNFEVNLQTSFDLVNLIPDEMIKVSESAISDPKTIQDLRSVGFDAFLIGENFMKEKDPALAMQQFVRQL